MTDPLVEDLKDSIDSFSEEARCPVCEGFGAMNQGMRDLLIATLPYPFPESSVITPGYDQNTHESLLQFEVKGHFRVADKMLAIEAWENLEGQLRQKFEQFLVSLHQNWQKANALAHLKEQQKKLTPTQSVSGPFNQPPNWQPPPNAFKQLEDALKAKWGVPVTSGNLGYYVNPKSEEEQNQAHQTQIDALAQFLAQQNPPPDGLPLGALPLVEEAVVKAVQYDLGESVEDYLKKVGAEK